MLSHDTVRPTYRRRSSATEHIPAATVSLTYITQHRIDSFRRSFVDLGNEADIESVKPRKRSRGVSEETEEEEMNLRTQKKRRVEISESSSR